MRIRLLLCALLALCLVARAQEPPAVLTAVAPVPTPGPAEAPLPSPDGRHLAYTSAGYEGLWILDLETGSALEVSAARGAGFHPCWSASGEVLAFRTQTGGLTPKVRIVVARPDGQTESASPLVRSLSLPFWSGETLGYYAFDGEAPRLLRSGPQTEAKCLQPPAATPEGRLWVAGEVGLALSAAPPDKLFYLPVLSPDGSTFVVECLDGHLYLGRGGKAGLEDLGPGSYPSFVRDGQALLFERTGDDGHRLVTGDLFLMDIQTRSARALTQTSDRIERRPAMGPDGRTVYFEEGGRLWKGVAP